MFNKLPTLMSTPQRSRTQCSYSGFNFGNYRRNRALLQDGFKPPQAYSNGTSVVGILYEGGVIIGADTRTTIGHIVGFELTSKIYSLHDFIYAGGCGNSQDLQQMANVTSSQLDLITMNNKRHRPRVCAANNLVKQYLYRFHNAFFANFIIAGVDISGPHLYCSYSDGCSAHLPYTVLGTGSWAAMSILESRWKPAMGESFARDLVCDAVAAGINNDLYSGSSVRLCIIRTNFTKQLCSQAVYIKPRQLRVIRPVPFREFSIDVVDKKVYPVTLLTSGMNLLQRRSSLDLSLQTAIHSEFEEDQQDNECNGLPTEAEEDQHDGNFSVELEDRQGNLGASLPEAEADREDNDVGAPPSKRAKY